MNILLIDNYDSFTYNLLHYVEQLIPDSVVVRKNDAFEMAEVEEYDRIILSPGPGLPEEAGQMMDVLKTYGSQKQLLGVCLGHQAMAMACGGQLRNLDEVHHGTPSPIFHDGSHPIFKDLSDPFEAGTYHSWVIDEHGFPEDLEVIARNDRKEIMAIRHRKWKWTGLQFHPESIMTPFGLKIIQNWLESDR